MNKSKAAFLFSAERLANRGLYMWTFTFAEVLDIKDTRKRWNHFLTLMKRRWPDLCGLRVFELHESHGLHVHLITNRFVDVNECRPMAKKAGWGRVHVQRVSAERAQYLSKYLSKEREPCLKRWRLWAGFGDWERVMVKDIELSRTLNSTAQEPEYTDCAKYCLDGKGTASSANACRPSRPCIAKLSSIHPP